MTHVDTKVASMGNGWASNAYMHFGCSRVAKQCDKSACSGAANKRVVNHDDALAF